MIISRYNNKQLYHSDGGSVTEGLTMRTSQEAARIALRIAPTPEGLDRDEIMRLVQEALPGTERVTIAGHVSLRKVGTSLIEASFIPTGEVLWIHVFPPKVPAVRKALLSLGLQAKKL